jgi:hypothetical protein
LHHDKESHELLPQNSSDKEKLFDADEDEIDYVQKSDKSTETG